MVLADALAKEFFIVLGRNKSDAKLQSCQSKSSDGLLAGREKSKPSALRRFLLGESLAPFAACLHDDLAREPVFVKSQRS